MNFWSCLNDDVVASLSGPEIRGREGKTDIEEQPKVKIKLVVFPLDGMMFEAAWKLV